MNKTIKQIICILLLLMCLLPLAVFVIAGPSASGANERLAAKPRLTAGGRLNFDVLSDTADYFDGHFGLRQELITANAAADAAIFRESATPGWLAVLRRHTGRLHRRRPYDGAPALVCGAKSCTHAGIRAVSGCRLPVRLRTE